MATNQYLRMKPPPEFPGTVNDGWAYVHHVVYWQKTGEIPSKEEGRHIHHINEDKHDNRPENLSMLTSSEHSKHHKEDDPPAPVEEVTCGWCQQSFTLESRKGPNETKAENA